MIRFRDRRFIGAFVAIAVLVIVVLPAFVAYRYTAPEQRGEFLTHPWRGWAFAYAAVAVPGDSELKTSGMALRKAEWLFRGTVIDPEEVQLLFVRQNAPYALVNTIGGREITVSVKPSYRFIWQVRGSVSTMPDEDRMIVALLDYKTGRLLYDVRDDLLPPVTAPSAEPSPSTTP